MESNFPLKRSLLYPTLLLGFLLYVHSYLPIYINSSFLDSLIGSKSVGMIFTIASIFSVIGLLSITNLLNKIGNFKTMLLVLGLELLVYLGLFYLTNVWLLLLLFILSQVLIRLLIFNVDIFLEANSKDEETGSIRGLFLTLNNMALVAMPFLAALIVSKSNYQWVYFFAAVALVPLFFVLSYRFRGFTDPVYPKSSFWQSLSKVATNLDLRQIYLSHFLLKIFYSVMVIYSPIYLHEVLNFSWESIGTMFTIMLLPFVLFELPIGKLADWKFGEKEILSLGFVIMGLSTMALYFVGNTSLFIIGMILFATRTGASAVEITSETYFFKKVNKTDTDMISFYRILDPLSYLVGPVIATISIYLSSEYRIIFLVLGILVLFGLRYSLTIKDTR